MEDNDLNRYVASLDDARLELTMRSSRNPNFSSVDSPSSYRQDPWQHQYDLANGFLSKDSHGDFMSLENGQILLRIKREFKMQSMRHLSSKHIGQNPDEVSASSRIDDDKIISNNALLIGKKQLKSNSRAGLSQLPVKETMKEKGIISRYQEACNVVVDQNDDKLGYDTEEASSTADAKSSGTNYQNFSPGVLRSSSPESYTSGISLRKWLKSMSCKSDKVESVVIFRQIVKLVDFAHSQVSALQDLRPSCFTILPSKKIQYTGSLVMTEISTNAIHRDMNKKRPLERNAFGDHFSGGKQQKLSEAVRSHRKQNSKLGKETEFYMGGQQILHLQKDSRLNSKVSIAQQEQSIATTGQLEKKWYTSPEELDERGCTFSSNVYGLGVLLFELLFYSESSEAYSAAMLDLHHRILPPKFLSEHPMEAGFCLWLLHPEPLSRPTTREILQSELISGSQHSNSKDLCSNSANGNDLQSELLLKFFSSLKAEKQSRASKLIEDIRCLEEDIKEVERKYLSRTASVSSSEEYKELPGISEEGSSLQDLSTSDVPSRSFSVSSKNEDKLMKNITQLEHAYFSTRSQIKHLKGALASQSDKDMEKKEDTQFHLKNMNADLSMNQVSDDPIGSFFDGLCKFARFSKFKVCGTLRNGDLFNSTNAICSLSLDRDEEYIAAAKVSKRIKIFEFGSLSNEAADIHYPVVEMSNKSKLSCISWNYYIKNYLASTDYDGVVKMWDANTGEGFSEYTEHQKRAWSVDFSRANPTMFASGSDDCSVKLWSLKDKSSIGTIWSPANVCCVQFSDYSNHQLVFGSADYKIYGYDLRHVRIPLCTLSGHGKAVSYVKFLDAETLVSASTDNTLKLWNLKKTISSGLSNNACSLSFKGHTNERNFVGLSVLDGYIVCGSETNEVYSYHRSLPMPITSHKFKTIDPISGHEIRDDGGQFVSSVCWRKKSNMVVAANSSGVLKLLQMVG